MAAGQNTHVTIKAIIFDCFGVFVGGTDQNQELQNAIKTLRPNFKIGLLSNAGAGFWKRFSEDELKAYFDDIVLSYQVGLVKPDPKIFELAAQRLGVATHECIFFDDDSNNAHAAKQCGMTGITYKWGMDIEQIINNLISQDASKS